MIASLMRRLKRLALALLLTAIVIAALLVGARTVGIYRAAPAAQGWLLIKADRLIDGRGGAPLQPAMVLLRHQRIVSVGQQVAIPAGTRIIDLPGTTLLRWQGLDPAVTQAPIDPTVG